MIKALTDRFVAGIHCDTRENVFDEKTRGLVLRVGARRKTWYFTYRSHGSTPQWVRLGEFPALTLAKAREAATDERHKLDVQKIDPAAARRAAKAEPAPASSSSTSAKIFTFADFIPVFVAFQRNKPKKTWRDDAAMIERFLREPWGSLALSEITRKHVAEALDLAAGKGLTVGLNRLQMLISRIFTIALDRGLVSSHPAARMIKRRKENARERVLTDHEIRAFWKGCDAHPGAASDALRLRLLLGQRGAEVLDMEWPELDLEAATWTIPGTRTKNGRPHLLALPPLTLAILTRRRAAVTDPDERRVFPGLTLAHDDYRALTPINGGAYEWIDLRRTFGTRLAELGYDKTTRGRILNHAKEGVTDRHYNQHAYLAEIRQALTEWDRELERILANEPRARDRKVVAMRGRRNR